MLWQSLPGIENLREAQQIGAAEAPREAGTLRGRYVCCEKIAYVISGIGTIALIALSSLAITGVLTPFVAGISILSLGVVVGTVNSLLVKFKTPNLRVLLIFEIAKMAILTVVSALAIAGLLTGYQLGVAGLVTVLVGTTVAGYAIGCPISIEYISGLASDINVDASPDVIVLNQTKRTFKLLEKLGELNAASIEAAIQAAPQAQIFFSVEQLQELRRYAYEELLGGTIPEHYLPQSQGAAVTTTEEPSMSPAEIRFRTKQKQQAAS